MRFQYPEGATPINDISGLIPAWVKTQSDLNRVEVENISYATSKYLLKPVRSQTNWFTVTFLLKIHHDMLGEVWDWAGSFRKVETIPGISPYRIRGDLENLCNEVSFWSREGAELTLLERAARIHHQLVFIHPFLNGNGRFSRLVADRYLKMWNCPIPHWPTSLINDGLWRKQYIESLRKADEGDLESLIQYMLELGTRDPALGELLGHSFYRQHYKGKRLLLLVKAHIRRGYDVNDVKNNGHRPLSIALQRGLREVAQLLIKNGADFKTQDKSRLSAFEWALIRELYDVAYEMYRKGHPYTPRVPQTLKVPQQNYYEFDQLYFS